MLSNTVLPNSFHHCLVLHIPLVLTIQCTPTPNLQRDLEQSFTLFINTQNTNTLTPLTSFFPPIKLAETNNHVNNQFGESWAKIYSDIAEGNII